LRIKGVKKNEQKNNRWQGEDFTTIGQAVYRLQTGVQVARKDGKGVQVEFSDPVMD
jgi:hypothetical protein